MKTRNTRQKSEIKSFLIERTDHPTADMVYTALKKKIPNISLGTVYRNLNNMADSGEILRISLGDGVVRFDARIDDHYHFICNSCGEVRDLNNLSGSLNVEENDCVGKIEGQITYFYGKCKECY